VGNPAAAGGRELGGAQRGHLDDGRSVGGSLAQERRHLRVMLIHRRPLPRRHAGRRRVRARAGGQGPLLSADPPRLPSRLGEAVSRPGGDRDRRRRGRRSIAARSTGARESSDALHASSLLERKRRAVAEATALLDWRLAPVSQQARAELVRTPASPNGNGSGSGDPARRPGNAQTGGPRI